MWTDPLPDKGEEYCPVREHDLIGEALRDAVIALAEFGTPTLTAPENASDTGL